MAGSVSIVNFTDRFTPHIKQKFWTIYAPVVLIVAFWWFRALYGFNPSDDGFILSQSWRIIHGEIPHVDFTSPRPLGSAYLHAPFALLPFAMLALSRLFVVFQFFWIAKMTVSLVRANGKEQKSWLQFVAISCVFVLNIGTWPIMAWHTVDGIFLGMTALAFSKRNIERSRQDLTVWILPFLCAGYAPLVKQNFLIVPMIVFSIVVFFGKRKVIAWTPLMGFPVLVYLVIAANTPGGILEQLYSGSKKELISPFEVVIEILGKNRFWNSYSQIVIALLIASVFVKRFPKATKWLALTIIFCAFIEARSQDFSMFGTWPYYFALVLLALTLMFCRDLFSFCLSMSVLVIGYFASLSFGVTNPGLIGGTFLFLALHHVMNSGPDVAPNTKYIFSIQQKLIAIGTLALIFVSTTIARDRTTYLGPSRELLNASVEYPQFKFVKMSAASAAYVDSVGRCLAKYPADMVAVLPDGPGLYPFFGLQNPFDSDWWYGAERVSDKSSRDLETVDELNGSSSWLVLVQSYFVFDLATIKVEDVSKISNPFFHDVRDLQILNALQGEDVLCDSFTGKYRPRGS